MKATRTRQSFGPQTGILLLLVSVFGAVAEDGSSPPAMDTATVQAAADAAAPLTESSGSTGDTADREAVASLRDPFWPLGWKPAPVARGTTAAAPSAQPSGQARWEEATRMLVLKSLIQLPGGKFLATLKEIGVVEPGDTIAVNYGGLTYRWEVQSITEKGIVPRRLGVTAQRGN